MSNDSPMIEIERFSFQFGKKPILRDVSFVVERGEYVSIIGPNGAGKTTLLKCIDRIIGGGTGRIEICGRPLAEYGQKSLAKLVGYVPQADGHVFPFTVEQFVLMARYPYLSPFSAVSREDHQAVDEALKLTGTFEFADRFMNTLSGGERQRVLIAAVLAQGVEIMLLDEPTTFLDYRHRDEVHSLLAKVKSESDVTILAVTHDVNGAAMESDRIVALRDGAVVFCGTPDEIMNVETLHRIYDSSFVLTKHPKTGLPIIVPSVSSEVTS